MKFRIINVDNDFQTNEKFVTITLSNTDIKIIKSAIEFYEGDKDDNKHKQKLERVRDNIHQTWRKLNPS